MGWRFFIGNSRITEIDRRLKALPLTYRWAEPMHDNLVGSGRVLEVQGKRARQQVEYLLANREIEQ